MKRILFTLLMVLPIVVWSQMEFHVFPDDHRTTPGTSIGNGSLANPWDLQTALKQTADVINGGDIIWLHEGIYNGRYVSSLNGTNGKKIIVSAVQNEKVIINGNVPSTQQDILLITGGNVIYKDFEITCLGEFSRNEKDEDFNRINGISHNKGEDCEFINLKIHNNPGSGIGSWHLTGGTQIIGCFIFNNGYNSTKRGSGVGIYVQNSSDKERLIADNIIFNNYYKGIEAWSANKDANHEYVKNISIINNTIFNNGITSNAKYDNIIVATDDRNSINIAKNIKVEQNILYHNTDFANNEISGSAPSLTVGFNNKAPVKNVLVNDNIIIGRNNGLRLLHVESIQFKNNTVYSGYVFMDEFTKMRSNAFDFESNRFYTKNRTPFLVQKHGKITLDDWSKTLDLDHESKHKHIKEFDLEPLLKINKINSNKTIYVVTLFDKSGHQVTVDFSDKGIEPGVTYNILSVETNEIIKSGKVTSTKQVVFPMASYNLTNSNFGIYKIEFFDESSKKKNDGFIKRLFGWLF